MEGHSLIPASQQQNAWFDIEISLLTNHDNKEVIIYLEDQLGRKWTSKVTMSFKEGSWLTIVNKTEEVNK